MKAAKLQSQYPVCGCDLTAGTPEQELNHGCRQFAFIIYRTINSSFARLASVGLVFTVIFTCAVKKGNETGIIRRCLFYRVFGRVSFVAKGDCIRRDIR